MKETERAAATIFLSFHDYVRALSRRYAPLPDISEDICQQVFLEFVSKSHLWNLEEDVRPLLRVLTKRFAERAIHEKKRTMPDALMKIAENMIRRQEEVFPEDKSDDSLYEGEKQALKSCIDSLPLRSRTMIELRFFKNVSIDEIAQQLSISSIAVRHALYRVRDKLGKCIARTVQKLNGHL